MLALYMLIKTSKKSPKSPKIFKCETCDYICSRKSEFTRHENTRKHMKANNNANNANKKITKITKTNELNNILCEKCNNKFKHLSSLSRHRKKCNKDKSEIISLNDNENTKNNKNELIDTLIKENSDFKNLILEVVKSNQNLQQQMSEICKSSSVINSHNTNSHNKTFNLQFFLNEECKDAMNLTDFINSVTLSLNDLENMGSSGYVNGISSIIIKELRGLDITKRPVHCSDAKRETLYIKDEDKWEKECSENTKIKTAIRTVEKKNIKLISEWTDKHPKFTNSTTKENDEYLQILIETMGGKGDYEKNKNKIIKNIAKEVIIEK